MSEVMVLIMLGWCACMRYHTALKVNMILYLNIEFWFVLVKGELK